MCHFRVRVCVGYVSGCALHARAPRGVKPFTGTLAPNTHARRMASINIDDVDDDKATDKHGDDLSSEFMCTVHEQIFHTCVRIVPKIRVAGILLKWQLHEDWFCSKICYIFSIILHTKWKIPSFIIECAAPFEAHHLHRLHINSQVNGTTQTTTQQPPGKATAKLKV